MRKSRTFSRRTGRRTSSTDRPRLLHVYVGELEKNPLPLPKDRDLVVHCSVGNRSGLAASILERQG